MNVLSWCNMQWIMSEIKQKHIETKTIGYACCFKSEVFASIALRPWLRYIFGHDLLNFKLIVVFFYLSCIN